MKKVLLALLLISQFLFSQSRKGNLHFASENEAHLLYVTFSNSVDFHDADVKSELTGLNPDFQPVFDEYQFTLLPAIQISEDKLSQLSEASIRLTKQDEAVQRLKQIYKVEVSNTDNQKLFELAKKLETFDEVLNCELISQTPVPPPTDIAPTTNNYEPNQTYLGANPGVNMQYAWGLGLTGTGIRVRDVEYGFNPNHEDLNSVNASLASGMTISSSATATYTEHGTSVFGIVFAHKGTYGISGMAYGAQEMILFPEWQQSGYDRVNAVAQSVANSQVGDVIIYEMQAFGQGGSSATNYVPAEYSQAVWDLTRAASDAGIIIVEAAANGNQNLDAPFYAPYMARGDSGAIIVGGGRSNTTHNRISYSTYGTRVDVQGWSENVFACGYGDFIQVGGDFNQGYTNFSGTSSATPIVASCVIVLQSYYFAQTGTYMTPLQMRTLLKTTGIPQGTGVAGNIGPLPNMQAAIAQINATLSVENPLFQAVSIYPNPVQSGFYVSIGSEISFGLEIVDAIGRVVLSNSSVASNEAINIANLPSGMYLIKITSEGKSTVKKLLKQ